MKRHVKTKKKKKLNKTNEFKTKFLIGIIIAFFCTSIYSDAKDLIFMGVLKLAAKELK
jgi:hypothetical protein